MDRHVAAFLVETRFCLCEPALAGVAIHRSDWTVFVLLYIDSKTEVEVVRSKAVGCLQSGFGARESQDGEARGTALSGSGMTREEKRSTHPTAFDRGVCIGTH